MKHGIDVSIFQPTVDWSKVDSRVDFVIIKLSQGNKYAYPTNALFNANAAHKAQKKVGYYHFASLDSTDVVADATAEAVKFCNLLKNLPVADLPHALDLEVNEFNLSKDQVELWATTWLEYVTKATGHECMLYTGLYFASIHFNAWHQLGKYKLWLSGDVRYHQYTSLTDVEKYRVPVPPIGWNEIFIWQYSDHGKLYTDSSISVDVNISTSL